MRIIRWINVRLELQLAKLCLVTDSNVHSTLLLYFRMGKALVRENVIT